MTWSQLLLKVTQTKNPGMSFSVGLLVAEMLISGRYRLTGQSPAPNQLLLTKGDNNPVDDIDLYNGISWLKRRHIVGKVRGSVPWLLQFLS